MSGLGAFAPLPLRLGGSATEGLTAQQHARIAADVAALVRASAIAVINYTKSGATITTNFYAGPDGVMTSGFPFTTADGGTGIATFTFPTYLEDEFGVGEPLNFIGITAGLEAATAGDANGVITSPNVFSVNTFNGSGTLADGTATAVIY